MFASEREASVCLVVYSSQVFFFCLFIWSVFNDYLNPILYIFAVSSVLFFLFFFEVVVLLSLFYYAKESTTCLLVKKSWQFCPSNFEQESALKPNGVDGYWLD